MARHYSPDEKALNRVVGQRLLERRLEIGYTRKYVVETAGIPVATYVNMEKGLGAFTVPQFAKVCILLDVSADEILGLTQIDTPMPIPQSLRSFPDVDFEGDHV